MGTPAEGTVFIVDDDPRARDSLAALVRSKRLRAAQYSSAEEFLGAYDGSSGCLVTALRLRGMTGLELQKTLKARGIPLPVIVIAYDGDVPTAVRAMKAGAVTFLEKPCSTQELWSSIQTALKLANRRRSEESQREEFRSRLAQLTPAESRVLEKLVAGKPNKAIALELDIGLRTVELRRSNIFKKMQAGSLAELLRMVLAARQDVGSPAN